MSIRLSEKSLAKLRRLAAKEQRTPAELVRLIVEAWLDEKTD